MRHFLSAAVAAALLLSSTDTLALVQRTFVSTAGSDINTAAGCSLVSPCRSFGSALSVTTPDGEIIVLDSGGYGRVTIDKSVAITAPTGVYAGISVFAGTNGIDVNGVAIVVALRGLTINGQGGDSGIVFTQGARLYIAQCTISNMTVRGIDLHDGETYITDTMVLDNLQVGIWAEGVVDVIIDRTRAEGNGDAGVRALNGPRLTVTNSIFSGNVGFAGVQIDSDDGSSDTIVTVSESSSSQNSRGFLVGATGAGSTVHLAVSRSTISRNGLTGMNLLASTGTLIALITDNTIVRNFGFGGVSVSGAGVIATVAANAISGNTLGLRQVSSAVLKTRSNNVVQDNTTDIVGTLTPVGGD